VPEQRGWSKRLAAALLLFLLLPSFVSLNPAPTSVSKSVLRPTPLAHAQPPYSNEKEFIDYVTNVLNRHSNTYLKKMSEKLGEHLYIFWKREIGVSGTALKQGTVEYQWAAQVINRLAAEGELAGEDLAKAWSEILAERKYDASLLGKIYRRIAGSQRGVVDIERVFGRTYVEAKAIPSNKGQTVAEMIRDLIYASKHPDVEIIYLVPDEPVPGYSDPYDWVKNLLLLNKVAGYLDEASGGAVPKDIVGLIERRSLVVTESGLTARGPRLVLARAGGFFDWLGMDVGLVQYLWGLAKTALITLFIEMAMRAVLVDALPQVLLANVSYNGYGNGSLVVTLTYGTGDWQGYRALYTEIGVRLNVNSSSLYLAHFYFPTLLSDGRMFYDVAPVVVPSDAEPQLPLPSAPGLLYDSQRLRIEVPLKQYTVKETRPDGSVVEKTVMDTLVLEGDVIVERIAVRDIFKSVIVKEALVDQLTLSQRLVNAPPPPSQVTNVNPAPPTPYVTVKASVASGCGRVAVVPLLWFYPSGPEVSVPNGSLVVLRAYPCDGCSLKYWQLSDGQRTWTVTGTYVGLRVNRSLTALAYFTDPPKQPKLVLRAESSDGAPIYVNMSGWVLWYSGAVYNTTLSNALFRSLDFPLRHDIPLGFKVTTNETAVWVGVPAVGYGSYSLSLDYRNTASGCTYVTWDSGSYSAISGLHLLLVQAKGDRATVNTKGGSVSVGDCKPTTCEQWNCYWIGLTQFCSCVKYAGSTARVSDWCVFTNTYNFNNARPEVSESVCGWISGTYSVAKKTQLKFLRWELRGPDGVIARWYDTQAYLPAWYNSTSYRWEGVFYPPYSKPAATYELIAIYGPPQATLTAKVSAVLPDGSRVYLSSVRVNATTVGASASALTNGNGIAQLSLPTGNPIAISFPRVIGYAPYRLVVENATFNGALLGGLLYANDAASAILLPFDKDGTVEIAYRAVAPLAVSWGPGGSVLPDFRQVVNGTTVYAEDRMPVTLVTKPASGYRFSRWVIVEKPWAGQPVSKSGVPWNGVLWVDTKYTGAWRVDAFFDFEPFYATVLTNVNLYVEAIDAQNRVRTLASRSLWLQYSGRQKVTLSWTGVLYNEWLRIRLTSDNSVTIYLMRLNATPAVLVLARENVTASQYAMYMGAWTARRYEGVVRIAVNASADVQRYPEYKWRLTVVAVAPDRKERVLVTTGWITGDKGTSASLSWTGALNDEWVKFVVENNQGYRLETLSAFVVPLLPANATVLYRWPVQLKAEFTRG
jgi:hypothetical protein